MFHTIEEALEAIRRGEQIIIVDGENRENEGDLVIAAEKVSTESINFMIKKGGGLICVSLLAERLEELQIDRMVEKNTDPFKTAFTVSVDAKDCHTGISASERAHTIEQLIHPNAKPADFNKPGHIFPLIAQPFGVLSRLGHTEASMDMARMAGLYPAGVICEIIKENGEMARLPDLIQFSKQENLKIISIQDILEYRRKHEMVMERVSEVEMPTTYGEFRMYSYVNKVHGDHHVALVKGNVSKADDVLVRVHSECLTGDVFGSMRCDCGEQLEHALKTIDESGSGVLLYMRQEGRGIGLINKLKAYKLQEEGMDTVEANLALGFMPDERDHSLAADMLKDLGIKKIRLMTNNPDKVERLEQYGIEVTKREPIEMNHNEKNEAYMKTKFHKMRHILDKIK